MGEDLTPYLKRYQLQFAQGIEGERQIRAAAGGSSMDASWDDVHTDKLSDEEYDAWRRYMGWCLWDVIAARSTEGESGLIPRQEYETLSFLQMWSLYPQMLREITDRVGVDGVIEIGRTPTREIGTKVNLAHTWSPQNCLHLGKAISVHFGFEQPEDRIDDLQAGVQFARRLAFGTWGGGPVFASGRQYRVPLLEQDLVDRFLADEQSLADPIQMKAFRRFNATTELLGYTLHYDCRFGVQDSGPYPVPGGGFMIVRDHWLNETAYPWSSPTDGLPYCVTEAMVFRPDGPIDVRINDLGTTFTSPPDYLKHIRGVAVYARDTIDTPMSEIRLLNDSEIASITKKSARASTELYAQLAGKDRDQKIRDGISVYAVDHIRPHARAAGLWDEFEPRINQLTDLTLQAWPHLAIQGAADVLSPFFVKGLAYTPLKGAFA
jgi:hypothetical protein